jgi:hypothetical protein
MATPPLLCKSDLSANIQQGAFDRCTFVVSKNSSVTNSLSFCNYSFDVDNFFTQMIRLNGGEAFLLDDAGLGNEFGEISFLLVGVTYSSGFTKFSDKYIHIIYKGDNYPIGGLHIWTGQPGDTMGMGIDVNPESSGYSSPYFSEGGVVFHNPHQNYVDLKIMMGAGGVSGVSTGSNGGPTFFGTSGTSGTSGSSQNADYSGTSGNIITIP